MKSRLTQAWMALALGAVVALGGAGPAQAQAP